MLQTSQDVVLAAIIQRAGWEQAVQHCLEQEQLEPALYYFAKLAELNEPLSPGLLQSVSEALFEAGRYEETQALLTNPFLIKEHIPSSLTDLLGRIYLKLGQREKAAEIWTQLLGIQPDYT